ncbi:MAG: hypothetical protein K6G31_07190 [Paludibacteraceae bacterium]|nr:hypothetical protein [Paludibacteraceae bacterium]
MKRIFVIFLLCVGFMNTYSQFSSFTPQAGDPSILQRSLQNLQRRKDMAVGEIANLYSLINEYRSKLPNDYELQQWYNDYTFKLIKETEEELDAGNYGNAYRLAIQYQGQLPSETNNKIAQANSKISRGSSIVYKNPIVTTNLSQMLSINSVELFYDKTIVTFSCKSIDSDCWMSINPSAYIVANGKKLLLEGYNGIVLEPSTLSFNYVGQILNFELIL